jgi:hypothetical protein
MASASPQSLGSPTETRVAARRVRVEAWLALFTLVGLVWAALNIDPPRIGIGLKGDEATYVSMALSAAYDGDLVYQRKDLERFWAKYQCGPDGIFLKRGKLARLDVSSRPPFVRFMQYADAPGDTLYYGKAFIHALVAAPFVRLFGVNGLPLLNVLLLALVVCAGYRFAVARCGGGPSGPAVAPAAFFTFAFFGASIVPVYLTWYSPEIFNLACVFLGYFFWLYKEVAPPAEDRWARFVRGRGSDLLGAVLLGMATFSKPLNVLFIGPLVLLLWWRRRWLAGLVVGVVFVATVGGLFSGNAAISGEFNYQGSGSQDGRKIFFTWFPLSTPEATFEHARGSAPMVTNDSDAEENFAPGFLSQLGLNVYYFFLGRHAGFVPYFFPGAVVLALWLLKWREIRAWQLLALGATAASTLAVLVMLPQTWNGGGGPIGNRYFLNFYPALFFLVPPLGSIAGPAVAWLGGTLFTAQALVNPFMAARLPYINADHGAVRMLPVELTMVDDLPIKLDRNRVDFPVGSNPPLSLFLIDENVYPPEPAGVWVHGERRGDLLLRSRVRLSGIRLTLSSAIPNTVRVAMEGRSVTVELKPGETVDVLMNSAGGVHAKGWFNYILSVTPSRGFVPINMPGGSEDKRFLGVLLRLQGVEKK